MKIKYSFLFFCFIGFLFPFSNSYSQKKVDSSRYFYDKIINPQQNSDLLEGYNFYQQRNKVALSNYDTLQTIYNLRMIALSQLKMSLNYETEQTIIEAISLIDHTKGRDTLVNAKHGLLIDLGRIYRNNDNYDKALEVYEEALQLSTLQKDSITIINNIGNIYFDRKEYQTALEKFNSIYDKTITNSTPLQKAMVLNNLGAVQIKLDHPDALKNLNTSLSIRKNEQNNRGIYLTYKNLFYYYKDRNQLELAKLYTDSAITAITKTQYKPYIRDALALYTSINEDPKIVEYKRLTDSIFKAEHIQKNEYSFNKYRYDKQEKIAIANQLQKEKEKRSKLLFQLVAICIFIGTIALYFVLRARSKKEKLKQIYLTETRISKRVHDEVANDVYQVMTKLQGNTKDQEEVLDDLETIYSKTRDISKDNSAINLNESFEILLEDLLLSYKKPGLSIITKNSSTINWEQIPTIKKTTLFRVIQELMTNMRKHSQATVVMIDFKAEKNKLIIDYKDNGRGSLLKKNVGLQNTENRMKAINGSIIFETEPNKGFVTKITM